MNPALAEALADLPVLLGDHLRLSMAALLVAILAGFPLIVAVSAMPRARSGLLAAVSAIQTVPAIALLALFYPMLLLLAQATGVGIPALGFLPSLLALALYALLPIMRNGAAAFASLPPELVEAADGTGMTRAERLRLVELPLGAPVILAGLRTAAVWTIGTATLSTTVGQPGLGNLIFSGLQTENWIRVLVGCVAAAALALAVDALIGLVESGVARRSRRRWAIGLAGLGALAGAALLPGADAAPGRREAPLAVIGAKNFSEQYILAALIEKRLQEAGYRTERRDDLGSAVAYRALAEGDIDIYVDYAGTLWGTVLGRTDNPPPQTMTETLRSQLRSRDGVILLGGLGFDNAYTFAMRRDRAERLGIRSIADLARQSPGLTLGTDIEFQSKPEWTAVADAYALRFAATRAYSPTFMYRALVDGSADVISAFSSDGRIAALGLVTLEDPKRAFPGYEAVLLLSRRVAEDEKLVRTLRPLVGAIPLGLMQQANHLVDRDTDKQTPVAAARWLEARMGPAARGATASPPAPAVSVPPGRLPDAGVAAPVQLGLEKLGTRRPDEAETDRPLPRLDRVVKPVRLDNPPHVAGPGNVADGNPPVNNDVMKPEIDRAVPGNPGPGPDRPAPPAEGGPPENKGE